MGFIVFEEEAFNYLDAQLENFVKRMDRIRERSEDKTMNKWLDTQDVCQTLNICPRTVQTLRDKELCARLQLSRRTLQDYRNNGVIPYIQLGGKILYRESDIQKILMANYREAYRKKGV